jgi:alkanesulfonate monooxygenase SsuD/methylene tetrahydromethanopterin reductase-like flavin-dependent oxidoreductase (luciferase family)
MERTADPVILPPVALLGFGLAGAAPIETIETAATVAEAEGYSSFWLSHPSPSVIGAGLPALGRAATVTSSIALGIGVIPLSDHGPDQIARQVTDCQLPVDRFRLGIGSGRGPLALSRVRFAAHYLRGRVDCELTIAALGPKMLQVAGQYADSVLLNWLRPDYALACADAIRAAATQSGRRPPRICAYVRVALGPGSGSRRDREAALYAAVPQYSAHFARMGSTAFEVVLAPQTPQELADGLRPWRTAVDEVIVRALPGEDSVPATLAILRAAHEAW